MRNWKQKATVCPFPAVAVTVQFVHI